jgi:hypothetical protein
MPSEKQQEYEISVTRNFKKGVQHAKRKTARIPRSSHK